MFVLLSVMYVEGYVGSSMCLICVSPNHLPHPILDRYEHVILQISWAFVYLLFCWPMVAAGALPDWPYFFLHTDTAAVFAWYCGKC
ncbi:hypothetical protein EON65_22880 [archaeon]|nr:MAG: hypothetical protein EON65_22880 [archaeon]